MSNKPSPPAVAAHPDDRSGHFPSRSPDKNERSAAEALNDAVLHGKESTDALNLAFAQAEELDRLRSVLRAAPSAPPTPSESPTPRTKDAFFDEPVADCLQALKGENPEAYNALCDLLKGWGDRYCQLERALVASLVEQERLRAGWVESDKIALAGRIADAASSAIAPFELKRLREVEHMAWHVLEDSEENATTGGISIQPNDDYFALCALLPDEHPGDGVPVDGGSHG